MAILPLFPRSLYYVLGRVRRRYSHPNCPTMLTFVRASHSRKSRRLALDVPILAFSAKKRLRQAELGEGVRRYTEQLQFCKLRFGCALDRSDRHRSQVGLDRSKALRMLQVRRAGEPNKAAPGPIMNEQHENPAVGDAPMTPRVASELNNLIQIISGTSELIENIWE